MDSVGAGCCGLGAVGPAPFPEPAILSHSKAKISAWTFLMLHMVQQGCGVECGVDCLVLPAVKTVTVGLVSMRYVPGEPSLLAMVF